MALGSDALRLAVAYSDHSLYVWDVSSLSAVVRVRSVLAHAACVWGVAMLPSLPSARCESPLSLRCKKTNGAISQTDSW